MRKQDKTAWIKAEHLTDEQRASIAARRFGRAHPNNYPSRPMREYKFWLVDGDGYRAGDVCGWGPIGYAM